MLLGYLHRLKGHRFWGTFTGCKFFAVPVENPEGIPVEMKMQIKRNYFLLAVSRLVEMVVHKMTNSIAADYRRPTKCLPSPTKRLAEGDDSYCPGEPLPVRRLAHILSAIRGSKMNSREA